MALIICPECSNSMSDTASACPHCGYSMDADSVELAKNPFGFLLKTITDLYIWCMVLALTFSLVSVEHFFFQFSVTIGEVVLHPWAVVPILIAGVVRTWVIGTVYALFVAGVLGFAAGMDNIAVFP